MPAYAYLHGLQKINDAANADVAATCIYDDEVFGDRSVEIGCDVLDRGFGG